ncbi:MAG: hypothetical protein EBZ36_13930 [Acidobacteria bacterium]|jgi:hypothetical protein|nr:hypothetical protein [Acidobacteriota bacterium]
MPNNSQQNQTPQSQTLVEQLDQLQFEAMEEKNGMATVIRFRVGNDEARAGDILLVLAGSEIHFHGFIGKIEDGWGIAMDRTGSALPAVGAV